MAQRLLDILKDADSNQYSSTAISQEKRQKFRRMIEERQYMVLDKPYVVAIGRGSIRVIWVASTPRRLPLKQVGRLLRLAKALGDQPTVTVEAWRPKQKAGWVKEALLPKLKGRLLVE